MSDLSFYSKEHGGTFHFMQFNIMYKEEFMKSLEFKHLLKFLDKTHPIELQRSKEQWGEFIQNLNLKKQYLEI